MSESHRLAEELSELLRAYSRLAREPDFLGLLEARVSAPVPLHLLPLFARVIDMGPATVNDLVATIDLAKSSVSRQISALERLDLVQKVPSPSDGRSILVSATSKGRRVWGVSNREFSTLIARQTAEWTEAGMKDFVGELRGLIVGIAHAVWPEGQIPAHIQIKMGPG
jgi:DNA-binding MarR family transcriptional regulator